MPLLLWVVFPYSIFMGCCSIMLGNISSKTNEHRRP